jgi:hypothetical protein
MGVRSVSLRTLSLSHNTRFAPQRIVDYVSPHGPRVTDVRAIVLQGAIGQVQAAGHFEDYRARLPAHHLAAVTHALASSWLPVDVYNAHLAALEAMGLSDAQIGNIAESLGTSLFDQLFATIVRTLRLRSFAACSASQPRRAS